MAIDAPYGSWPSPITAKYITASSVRLGQLTHSVGSGLHWLEGRPQEKGRQVVVRYAPTADGASERGAVDVTPPESNARTRVHEYGGGAYVLPESGGVIYSDFGSQRVYWSKSDGAEPLCLTPHGEDRQYFYADGVIAGGRLVCVREDHTSPAPAQVVNQVVAVALDGSGETEVLASGRDFYAAPRVSPSGSLLAYVCWDHPSMPWDATELRVRALGDTGGADSDTSKHALCAGEDGDTSVLQPAWHPTTGSLHYISDVSGFYNLYAISAPSADGPNEPASLYPRRSDFGGSSPGWQLGQQGYAFLEDGRLAAAYTDREDGGKCKLLLIGGSGGHVEFTSADGLPDSFGSVCPAEDGTLYVLGGSPAQPAGVYAWEGLKPGAPAPCDARLLASSSSSTPPENVISVPTPIEFDAPMGTSYAYYYPPW